MGSGARIIDVDEAAVEACIVALPPLMMLLVASLGFSLSLCDSEKKKRWSFFQVRIRELVVRLWRFCFGILARVASFDFLSYCVVFKKGPKSMCKISVYDGEIR